jgi:hypothetical protein
LARGERWQKTYAWKSNEIKFSGERVVIILESCLKDRNTLQGIVAKYLISFNKDLIAFRYADTRLANSQE